MNKLKHQSSKLIYKISPWIMLFPTIFVLYFMIWRPQIMGFVWSFHEMNGFQVGEFCGLKNYMEVLNEPAFLSVFVNTVEYVLWSMVIGFVLPIILAVMINELRRGKDFFKVTLYLPGIVPGIAVMVMWYFMFYPDATGLLNALLAKIGVEPLEWLNDAKMTIPLIVITKTWRAAGGSALLYFTALQGIKTELYEAAIIDGASVVKRFFSITLPQISGLLVLNFVRQIIAVFQISEEPMTMTGGGPMGASMSLGYQIYRYGFISGRVGCALALSVLMFVMLVVATLFYFYLNKKVEENLE